MADETNATPSAPEDMPQGTGKITIADICQCDNPCECMKDYEVRVTVVTRLAGIPVSGVRMEVAGQSLVSDGDGLLTAFKSDAEELNLELTYANQQAQLKTETVTVALKNLLPTCLAVKKDGAGQSGATAEFEHFIPKIRDVLDLPEQAAMALRQEAEKEVAQAERDLQWAQIKLENVESQYPNIPASDVLALKELAAKEVEGAEKKLAEAWQKVAAARQEEKFAEFAALNDDELKKKTDEKIQKVGPDNVDADFNDTYTIQATAYTEPPEDTETTATPPQGAAFENVDSALQVEKTPANRIIFHLRVALATFSLAVPYMSQVASHVDILRRPQGETGRSGVETWIPIAMTTGTGTASTGPTAARYRGQDHPDDDFNYYINGNTDTPTLNPWHKERLCSPTSSTMILKYYGISGARDDIQARADFMALHVDLVVSPPPSPQPQQPHAYPWEERRQVARAFRETVHRACGITVEAEFIDVHETFLENFIRLLPYLSYGHPLQVRIIGGHIIVVRGAVIKRDESELWAICNDPYGTLAGQTANYRNTTNPYIWYEQEGQGSSSRRGRNLEGVDAAQQNEAQQNEDEAQRQQRRKGQHVYYNQTVHTRGGDRHFNFTYFVYMLYRHANDASMRRKDFVQAKLTRGE